MSQWNLSSSASITPVSSSSNEIKFVSNFPYGSAVVGATELSYNSSGRFQKATIILNDDYEFYGSPGRYGYKEIFLGDVVTHELGHVFGMSHSEVLDASMFYSSFSGQSTVAYDDQTGVRQKYDSGHGKITGLVKGGRSIGVLGVHVQAISRSTGKATAAVSDENGYFELGGLNLEDTYYLYTAPIKNSASLPGYFANVQDKFCPAAYSGSFFSKCGHDNEGKPQGISLTQSAPQVDVGTVTINCGLKANEDFNAQKLKTSFSPITIFNYDISSTKVEQAYVGWFRNPPASTAPFSSPDIFKTDFTALNDSSLFVKFSLISFPLGTQLEYEVDISNAAGTIVSEVETLAPLPTTDTYNTDYEIFLPISSIAANNLFEFKVRAKRLGSTYAAMTFPSYDVFSSSSFLPYLIVVSLWEGVNAPVVISEANLSDNEACLDAPYTYAVKQAKEIDDNVSASEAGAVAATGCGTIGPPKNGPGSSLGLMTLGFLLTLLASTLTKSRKKFLS
jgi:hypothetical protein